MPHCKQRKRKKHTGFFAAAKWGVCFAVMLVCMGIFTACAKGDKYVEIVITSSDVVITPVPMAEATERVETRTAAGLSMETPVPQEQPREQVKTIQAEVLPSPVLSPSPTPTPLPTATPIPLATMTPTITPTIKPSPTPTIKPTPTPAPKPSATPAPEAAQPDTDRQLQQELDAAYLEYEAEWWAAYERFSEKCLPVLDTIEFMGEPSDDPEYLAEMARLQAELDALQAEFEAEITAIEAASLAKQQAIYAKYGK